MEDNSRSLVEKTFVELGFPNENPSDLDAVAELLDIWRNPEIDASTYDYTPEQYVLLNDPDVIDVLNRCREYYEPKRRLSDGEKQQILENIASGRLTRKSYDFKSHSYIIEEPTFSERLTAIRLLNDIGGDIDGIRSIQFINNVVGNVPEPKTNPLDAPPPDHYSLKLDGSEGGERGED